MTVPTVAPFPGVAIDWNWPQHLGMKPPSLGGTDYAAKIGAPVPACSEGTIHLIADAFHTIEVHRSDGTVEVHEENLSVQVREGQQVAIGTVLAYVGLIRAGAPYVRSPHIHGRTVDGKRHPFNEPQYGPSWVTPVLRPTQRLVGSAGANQRRTPTAVDTTNIIGRFNAGDTLNLTGWCNGVAPAGSTNRVWFEGTAADYFWSGTVTDPSTHDLPQSADWTPPSVTPPVAPAPIQVTPPIHLPPPEPFIPPADPISQPVKVPPPSRSVWAVIAAFIASILDRVGAKK